MTTLFDLTKDLADVMMKMRTGKASDAGTKLTLLDTTRVEPDDFYHAAGAGGGVLFLLSGDNDGKSRALTNWVNSTGTFTWVGDVAANTASDDDYSVSPIEFGRDELFGAINTALRELRIRDTDVSLVTVEDQMEYTLPTGAYNLKRVEVASYDAAPYKYAVHYNWTEDVVNEKLVFDDGFQLSRVDYKIRITFEVPPDAVDDDADTVLDTIPRELIVWSAAVSLWRNANQSRENVNRLNEAIQRASSLKQANLHLFDEPRDPHLSQWRL